MGERADGVSPAKEKDPESIVNDISTLRGEIGGLVDELDRRRREVFDVKSQMRRHPQAVSVGSIALAALVGGTIALLIFNSRRRRRPSYRAKQLRIAFDRVMKHPERVARGESPPGEKILAAIGTAAASLLVKRALDRAVPTPKGKAFIEAQTQAKAQADARTSAQKG